MNEELDRRDAVKTVAAAGGLLVLSGLSAAEETETTTTLTGEWFNGGNLNKPCAIFQQGRILLLINEKGDIASGLLNKSNQLTVLKGWVGEVVGNITGRGRVITWKDGGTWKRR